LCNKSNPTAEQLAEIAISSADSSLAFGIEPKIAMLSILLERQERDEVDKVRAATVVKKRPDLKLKDLYNMMPRSRYGSGTSKMPNSECGTGKCAYFSRFKYRKQHVKARERERCFWAYVARVEQTRK
jgi:phosphate acetyltransferase